MEKLERQILKYYDKSREAERKSRNKMAHSWRLKICAVLIFTSKFVEFCYLRRLDGSGKISGIKTQKTINN